MTNRFDVNMYVFPMLTAGYWQLNALYRAMDPEEPLRSCVVAFTRWDFTVANLVFGATVGFGLAVFVDFVSSTIAEAITKGSK